MVTLRIDRQPAGTTCTSTGGSYAVGKLPHGWEEHHDDDGTPYFFHTLTRRTTWVRPRPPQQPGAQRCRTATRAAS